MKTSSWFLWSGLGRIGISRGTPRGMRPGYRLHRPLNPTRELFEQGAYSEQAYRDTVLAPLDPCETCDALHALAHPDEPILLCYEHPPFRDGHNCHRRFVARWFEECLGVDVPEIEERPSPGQRGLFDD